MPNHATKRGEAGKWLRLATVVLVAAAIAVASLTYGAVEAWSEAPLVLFAAVLTGLALLGVARSGIPPAALAPAAVLLAFALLMAIQSVPLPSEVVASASSRRFDVTGELLGAVPPTLTLSYYPLVTEHGLRLHLVGLAVFISTAVAARDRRTVRLLLTSLFIIGVAEATLSVAQIASGAEGIFWSAMNTGPVRSGSFINHSNFSQLLNLTGGAGLGLLLMRLREDLEGPRFSRRRSDVRELLRRHGWLLAGLALHAVAIAASLSRGGVLGMFTASFLVAWLVNRRRALGWRIWALVAVPPIVFAGISLLGFDVFYDRLATLDKEESYADRFELGVATLRMAADHPVAGVGMDAYQFVFPEYDTTRTVAAAEQADNDYAQLAAEMGAPGVVLVGLMIGLLANRIARVTGDGSGATRHALYGVMYGLVAVAVQSLTDFGQRVPAVFCVTAALCGLCFAAPFHYREPISKSVKFFQRQRHWVAIALACIAIPCWWWAGAETLRDVRAERWWSISYEIDQRIRSDQDGVPQQQYIDLVAAAEAAAAYRPANVTYAYWLNAYRWQALLVANGLTEATLGGSSEASALALKIAEELAKARSLCPTFGPAYSLEGRIRIAVGDPSGVRLVKLGAQLAPKDPSALFAAGVLEATSSKVDPDAAYEKIRLAVEFDGSYFLDACLVCVNLLDRPELARRLTTIEARQQLSRSNALAELLERLDKHPELATELRDLADSLGAEAVRRGEASSQQLIEAARRSAVQQEFERAVALYRRALAKDYGNTRWRLELADALIQLSRYREAEREARLCLRIHPGDNEALRKLEAISLLIPADD